MEHKIERITGREIIDSRGNPTVEAEITLNCGTTARASVPSGASTGEYEAHELRETDAPRYKGKGVMNAVRNINEMIAPKLCGMNPLCQMDIDCAMNELDGTKNKSKLGANAILAVSLAAAKVSAKAIKVPLYAYLG